MKCPNCGNNRFHAHQTTNRDVVVDEDGDFVEERPEGLHPSEIYEVNKPYGPYVCTECDEEFEDLTAEAAQEGATE